MGANNDRGDTVDLFVQAHFRALGYELGWPRRDSGVDFLISRDGGPYQKVQVKHLKPVGTLSLRPPVRGRRNPTKEERRSAAEIKRPYDLLVIACADRMWVIPEEATRGITTIGLKAPRTGKWYVNTKWNQYLTERQTWVKPAEPDSRSSRAAKPTRPGSIDRRLSA